jgi:hypothetical protein
MAGHSSEKRWRNNQTSDSGAGISVLVSTAAEQLIGALVSAEALYEELLEVYQQANTPGGGSPDLSATAQGLANQLFYEDWVNRESDPIGNPGVFDTQANADEVQKAQDLIDCVTAMHQLYQAANNVSVTQSDRFAVLRRMS